MNIKQNIGLCNRPCEQQKERGWCNFAWIHKLISRLSALCSFTGASLFGGFFFGLTDMLGYKNTKLIYESAHYMVIIAVVLFFLAFLLSFFKEDSKQNNPIVANQMNIGESMQLENNRTANISTNKLNVTEKLKFVDSNSKQGIISENIKPIHKSSKELKFSRVSKEEIVTGDSHLRSSCKNFQADQSKQPETANTLPLNTSSKTQSHASIPKQRENAIILSSHISSKTLQDVSRPKQGKSESISSSNISSIALQKSSTSEECDKAKVLSPNISSTEFQHANISEGKAKTLNTKPRSQSVSEKPSHFDGQLVPYEKRPKIPILGKQLQTSPPYQACNFYQFMSPNASGYGPITEVTATKRMTFSPWGTQEEYQIHQRTFHHAPGSPQVSGFSPHYGFRQIHNYNPSSSGVQEYQVNQTNFYQHPSHLIRNISNSSRPNHNDQNEASSSMFNQQRENKVSDMMTRLESMNIFH